MSESHNPAECSHCLTIVRAIAALSMRGNAAITRAMMFSEENVSPSQLTAHGPNLAEQGWIRRSRKTRGTYHYALTDDAIRVLQEQRAAGREQIASDAAGAVQSAEENLTREIRNSRAEISRQVRALDAALAQPVVVSGMDDLVKRVASIQSRMPDDQERAALEERCTRLESQLGMALTVLADVLPPRGHEVPEERLQAAQSRMGLMQLSWTGDVGSRSGIEVIFRYPSGASGGGGASGAGSSVTVAQGGSGGNSSTWPPPGYSSIR